MPKVTIYTQVHNAGDWLDQCVSSVLSQTYTDFEYLLVDSGSTDGSTEKIKAYAERDPRIKAILLPENKISVKFGIVKERATGEYFATLDHDDWWEPIFLERLVGFAEDHNLDLAITGVKQHFEKSNTERVMRQMKRPVTMTPEVFAKAYAQLGPFAGAWWASIMRTELYFQLEEDLAKIREMKLVWRSDTISMLKCIERCTKLGIDNSVLQHYRMHNSSQIQQYNEKYFDSCVIFCEVLEEFLRKYDAWNPSMQEYLKKRFLFEAVNPLYTLNNSNLPDTEKVKVCARIAEHPRTGQALSLECPERVEFCKYINIIVLRAIRSGQLTGADVGSVKKVLRLVAPDCIESVTADSFSVFVREPLLLQALLNNDTEALIKRLLQMMEEEQYPEYALGAMLHGLLPEDSPLYLVTDPQFFRQYADIPRMILKGGYLAALDKMTECLLSVKIFCDREEFLQVYLILAALVEQIPAFIFGKIRLAELYQQVGRLDDCRNVIAELEEMGAGEHEEVLALRAVLIEKTGGGL